MLVSLPVYIALRAKANILISVKFKFIKPHADSENLRNLFAPYLRTCKLSKNFRECPDFR